MRRRTPSLRIWSALALMVLLAAAAGAQAVSASSASSAGRWTRIGPDGGAVLAIAAAPSRPATIYAGLHIGGVFRSTDAGVTWAYAGHGIGFAEVAALAVDAARPSTVYAATLGGLYRTTDGGGSWAHVSLGSHTGYSATAVAADPRRSGTVYLALHQKRGIFASADGGNTWRRLNGSPPDFTVILRIDPVNTTTLYAGEETAGTFKSTDAGAHWQAIDPRGVAALAIDPRHPQTLFLAPKTGSLFRSDDGGRHWTRSDAGLGTARLVKTLAVDPAISSIVFAGTADRGVFRSTDGGRAWRPASAGLPNLMANALLANSRGLFVGTYAGVWESHDRAFTWQSGHGLSATRISSLALDSQDPPRLYAFDPAGLFKSADRGASWERLPFPNGPGDLAAVGPVVVDPQNPLRIELGLTGSVARSEDGGLHWQSLFSAGCVNPSRILPDPSDSEILYVNGGFASADCGLQPGACYSYRYDHGQVTCLRDPDFSRLGIPVTAVDPAAPRHLFGGLDTLLQSFDAGASWSPLSSYVLPEIVVFDPVHPGTLYASTYPAGVARSTDGGAAWQVSITGLPSFGVISSLVIDPTLPSTLYASGQFNVYGSTDSGATWTTLGTGIEDALVSQLALDPLDSKILYAATYGGGVMVLHLGD
jgi:photosystem II stability/assembly factor-like uncharacterized protein